MPTRRLLLATLATVPAIRAAWAAPDDPRKAERAIGATEAKVTVQEYFSLTCTHCADFQKETFPKVKAELIDTGKVRWIWRDYPLDQIALYAAMVARALPPERYEPFITVLLTTQDRWAFARNLNPIEEVMKIAVLAGMPRETFDKTVRDEDLKQFILDEQGEGEKKYKVQSTPTFVINEKPLPGAVPYDTFLKAITDATPS